MNDRIFKHFKTANAGRYIAKQEFYSLKNKILKTEGLINGYDIQITPVRCYYCHDGIVTRINRKIGKKTSLIQQTCEKCNGSGIYRLNRKYLIRYFLNGELFHLPSFKEPETLQLQNTYQNGPEANSVSLEESYYSLLVLLFYYDPERIEKLNHYQKLMEIHSKNLEAITKEVKEIKEAIGMRQ